MIADRPASARAWFEQLRDDICAAFEALEDALPARAPLAERAALGEGLLWTAFRWSYFAGAQARNFLERGELVAAR